MTTINPTLALTKELIAARSITPNDAGCQAIIAGHLAKLGFSIEELNFSDSYGDVKNFWARRGNTSPCLVFAGHTDVVPTGELTAWDSDPFVATERGDRLFGRGSADMKCSLAAFITSIERFVTQNSGHRGSIALLITSDEEGPATCGTRKVIEVLEARGEKFEYCLVGEPSSELQLGDTIKNGRRGSLGCSLTIIGTQGHIAYPHLAENPIHHSGAVIQTLTSIEWDQGNEYFPATSLQISNFNSGSGASNIIPGEAQITFNLRFSTEINDTQIRQKVEHALDQLDLEYAIKWTLYGQPFLTEEAELVEACRDSIKNTLGLDTKLSTSGGTSDGRFIAPTGAQVVELGPVNDSIHKVNENIDLRTPERLSDVYLGVMQALLL